MQRVAEYQILKELTETGTGRLFVASRRSASGHDQRCVVKVFHDRFRRNSFFTSTLFAEAPSAVRFRHDLSVPYLDVDDRDGRLFVAMEQAEGPTWAAFFERAERAGRTPSTESILFVGARIARMLEAAQSLPWSVGETDGLIIGQLAPPGVILTADGQVRVLGVGLGRSRTCLPPTPNRIAYRAPELFLREPAQAHTDAYALGMMLVDGIRGAKLVDLKNGADAKAAVLNATLPAIPEVPPHIEELLRRMLSKDTNDRLHDFGAIAAGLEAGVSRPQNVLVAEWADNVKALFPEMSNGDQPTDSVDLPRFRKPRVSVPYSRTNSGVGEGMEGAARPRASTADIGPAAYDIEDLASALATGDLDANQTVETPAYSGPSAYSSSSSEPAPRPRTGPTPPPRTPSQVGPPPGPSRSGSFETLSLQGLEDSENEFDVDSVVNAIVSASSEADTNPSDGVPASAVRKVTPLPRSPSFPGAFPPFDEEESFPSEPPTRHGLVDVPPAPSGKHSPWNPQPEVERMAWGARVRVDAQIAPEPAGGTDSLDIDLPEAEGGGDVVELRPGDVIQDRYRVIDELGRGGMSIVYRAEHTLLLKDVAMKLLRPELSMLKNVVERFQREARSVCRLDDPNIVRVTDFGRTAEGLLYLVMDLIDGRSLASMIDQEGRMPPDRAIPLVDQILSGLEHAHRFEIVHRDLKPENIMLVERDDPPIVKILDFGIAKLGNADQKSITQAGTVFGTPRYMSPEQAAGEPVDHRTDLYTVGVILYQLLTGRVPFEGESTVQLLAKVLTQDPPPLDVQGVRETTRQALEQVIFQALAKEPEDRFTSARAFRRALESCTN